MLNSLIEKGFISQYARELTARVSIIPDNRKTLILQKLIHLQTKSYEYEEKGFLHISPAYHCEHCCWNILITMETEDAYTTLKELIDSANSDEFDVLTDMVVKIERTFGHIGNSSSNDYRVITEDQLAKLDIYVLNRVKEVAKTRFLFKSKSPWGKYWLWKYKEPRSLRNHISNGLNSKVNVPYYLAAYASFCTGGKTHGWDFKKENIEEYISIDKAYDDLITLKNTEIFSNLEVDVKEIALAYYLWYDSDRKQHDFISKEKVDSIMPEWECK